MHPALAAAQSERPPVTAAAEDEPICHLAASLPSCLDLPMGAGPTVGGSAARRVFIYSDLQAGSGCGFLQEVLSPPPGLIISQKNKIK